MVSDGLRALGPILQELVIGRGAGPVAGEEERHQTVDAGTVLKVVGPEQMVRLGWRPASRPFLTDQSPLVGSLALMAARESHPVRGGEQEGGAVLLFLRAKPLE